MDLPLHYYFCWFLFGREGLIFNFAFFEWQDLTVDKQTNKTTTTTKQKQSKTLRPMLKVILNLWNILWIKTELKGFFVVVFFWKGQTHVR